MCASVKDVEPAFPAESLPHLIELDSAIAQIDQLPCATGGLTERLLPAA